VPGDPESLPDMDGGHTLGAWPAQSIPHYLDGMIAEVLIYDVELTDAEREAIEDHLMGKYGTGGATSG
jgi:hypothetical protein